MNVIEDVRIEKLIKNRYPGLRKAFLEGYKQLNDKDFFGTQGSDLKGLLLIDRINLYYKCGFNCGVQFTPVEMEFVRRADRCLTMNDVYVLAEEIWEYSKDARKAKRKAAEEMREQNGEDPQKKKSLKMNSMSTMKCQMMTTKRTTTKLSWKKRKASAKHLSLLLL
jgi:hypothetical protein